MYGIGWEKNGIYYWYDANTSYILRVSKPIYYILTDNEERIARLSYKKREQAYKIINEFRQKYGVFKQKSTIKRVIKNCDMVRQMLNNNMKQLVLNITDWI